MKIFARHGLTPGCLGPREDALLLEGSWPEPDRAGRLQALDDLIDSRFAWIDEEASRLADELTRDAVPSGDGTLQRAGFAWLDALRLRYELVKLLRVVAHFETLAAPDRPAKLEVYVERDLDHDYEALLRAVARRIGARLTIVELFTERVTPRLPRPANRLPRRLLSQWTDRLLSGRPIGDAGAPRVVLCGNPNLLDPLCRELSARDCRLWWLHDRFPIRNWLRWQPRGVHQLACDLVDEVEPTLSGQWPAEAALSRDLDLAEALRHWNQLRVQADAPRFARLARAIREHFQSIRPTHLILDEDCSPLQRVAIAAAREVGATSLVVQHGIPAVRFGYAPLAADRICAWNEASAAQLRDWGVPAQQIVTTGGLAFHSPSLARRPGAIEQPPRVLLLATTPATSRRPDAVSFSLTEAAERELYRAACQAVQHLGGTLLARVHPRRSDRAALQSLFAEFPKLRAEFAPTGPLEACFAQADVAISCASTAGYQAVLAGVPVVQLLPRGAGDLLADASWGWRGTARSADELVALLQAALADSSPREVEPLPELEVAAARIADAALGASALAARV